VENFLPHCSLSSPPHGTHGKHHHKATGPHTGKTILVVGAPGGVGSFATQLAKLFGLRVVATASREESKKWATQMGADHVVDHTKSYESEMKAAGVDAVDFVFNTVSETLIPKFIGVVKSRGRVVGINGDYNDEALKILNSAGFVRRITFALEFMFSRPMFHYEESEQGAILDHVAELIDRKEIKPIDTETLSWKDMEKAHQKVESKTTIGKIVLKVRE